VPADIAGQIIVMSSPVLSGHITGQVIMIEGGMEGAFIWNSQLSSVKHTMSLVS